MNIDTLHLLVQPGAARPGAARPGAARPGVARPGASPLAFSSPTPLLDQFAVDLTQRARDGKIDPVRGRETELRQIIDILLRERQNNPVLAGAAGVGKTALVEGLAQRIAQGDVPSGLRNASIRSLDLDLLQESCSTTAEWNALLKALIAEAKASPIPIILFIDAVSPVLAAGSAGTAQLLMPALAQAPQRTITATNWAEAPHYLEHHPALARRFQLVRIMEPSEDEAIDMLRGIAAMLQFHHQVEITDTAVSEAVKLSHRYISGQQLPDKAIGVLSTACARACAQPLSPLAPAPTAQRLAPACVDARAVAQVISEWTGIPFDLLLEEDFHKAMALSE